MRKKGQGLKVRNAFTKPMTQLELCAAAGVTQNVVSRELHEMMDNEPRKAHIGSYRAGTHIAIYHPGPGKDCDPPPSMSCAERTRRMRKRNRDAALAERERDLERERIGRREHALREASQARPHSLTCALFGMEM